MPITIYGIKNCDTMKKARAWLDKRGVDYAFHDYKTAGIERAQLEDWCKKVGWEVLLNRAGTTFRKLPDNDKNGIDEEKLAWVKSVKNVRRGRIAEYAKKFRGAKYVAGQRPWGIKCDCAFPCATQNEITGEDAKKLLANGCYLVSEAANMPTVPAGVDLFLHKKILFGPGKAANAGGVATSGLEMSQNSMRLPWPREEVDSRLRHIMSTIFKNSWETAEQYGHPGNLVVGANIAGFVKVADAMLDQGVV